MNQSIAKKVKDCKGVFKKETIQLSNIYGFISVSFEWMKPNHKYCNGIVGTRTKIGNRSIAIRSGDDKVRVLPGYNSVCSYEISQIQIKPNNIFLKTRTNIKRGITIELPIVNRKGLVLCAHVYTNQLELEIGNNTSVIYRHDTNKQWPNYNSVRFHQINKRANNNDQTSKPKWKDPLSSNEWIDKHNREHCCAMHGRAEPVMKLEIGNRWLEISDWKWVIGNGRLKVKEKDR